MAQIDQRVIVVDADLRRPSLHRLFRVPNEAGLTTMTLDDSALQDPPLQDTSVPGLRVLASGTLPPRPSTYSARAAWRPSLKLWSSAPTWSCLTRHRSPSSPTR
jgi:Mrp family chromosome partitioning ATPase